MEYFAGEGIGKGLSEEPTPGSFEWGLEGIVGLSSDVIELNCSNIFKNVSPVWI